MYQHSKFVLIVSVPPSLPPSLHSLLSLTSLSLIYQEIKASKPWMHFVLPLTFCPETWWNTIHLGILDLSSKKTKGIEEEEFGGDTKVFFSKIVFPKMLLEKKNCEGCPSLSLSPPSLSPSLSLSTPSLSPLPNITRKKGLRALEAFRFTIKMKI